MAKYYRWTQFADDCIPDQDRSDMPMQWYLELNLSGCDEWDLQRGITLDLDACSIEAVHDRNGDFTDYPFTSPPLPVCSPALRRVLDELEEHTIQYMPLAIRHRTEHTQIDGYCVANYLRVIDCLDRTSSVYKVWTKQNLLFWEQRPYMLGRFRDVQKAILRSAVIGDARVFRVWGWETMIVVREEVRAAIKAADITGCLFSDIEVV